MEMGGNVSKNLVLPPACNDVITFQRVCSLGVSLRVFIRWQIFSVEYLAFALNSAHKVIHWSLQCMALSLGEWPNNCF